MGLATGRRLSSRSNLNFSGSVSIGVSMLLLLTFLATIVSSGVRPTAPLIPSIISPTIPPSIPLLSGSVKRLLTFSIRSICPLIGVLDAASNARS